VRYGDFRNGETERVCDALLPTFSRSYHSCAIEAAQSWDADVVVVEGQEQYTVQNSKNDKKLCSVEVRK